jgi:hypothetical protein
MLEKEVARLEENIPAQEKTEKSGAWLQKKNEHKKR